MALTKTKLVTAQAALHTSEEHVLAEVSAHHETQLLLEDAQERIADDTAMFEDQYHILRNAKRQNQRLQLTCTMQRSIIHRLKAVLLPAAESRVRLSQEQLLLVSTDCRSLSEAENSDMVRAQEDTAKAIALLSKCRQKIKNLHQQASRIKKLGMRR